jgi:hypothetical protein
LCNFFRMNHERCGPIGPRSLRALCAETFSTVAGRASPPGQPTISGPLSFAVGVAFAVAVAVAFAVG